MTAWIFLAVVIVLAFLAFAKLKKAGQDRPEKKGTFAARNPVTANEQPMYWRLVEAFPADVGTVHCQMSFGALLRAKDGASRYSFAQKMADFVVMDKAFRVLAIVELDDSSHKGKEDKDDARDAMLIAAGYRVVRYKSVPSVERLKADIPSKSV